MVTGNGEQTSTTLVIRVTRTGGLEQVQLEGPTDNVGEVLRLLELARLSVYRYAIAPPASRIVAPRHMPLRIK
jgi:hypothetical protein